MEKMRTVDKEARKKVMLNKLVRGSIHELKEC